MPRSGRTAGSAGATVALPSSLAALQTSCSQKFGRPEPKAVGEAGQCDDGDVLLASLDRAVIGAMH